MESHMERLKEIINGDPINRDRLEQEALLADADSIMRSLWAYARQLLPEDDWRLEQARTWQRIYHKDPTIADACVKCEGVGSRYMADRYRKHARCNGTGYLTAGTVDRECFCGEDDEDELRRDGFGWICKKHERLRDYHDEYLEAEADYALSLPESER